MGGSDTQNISELQILVFTQPYCLCWFSLPLHQFSKLHIVQTLASCPPMGSFGYTLRAPPPQGHWRPSLRALGAHPYGLSVPPILGHWRPLPTGSRRPPMGSQRPPPVQALGAPTMGFQHVYCCFSQTACCGCLLSIRIFFILNGKFFLAQNCLKTVFRPKKVF